MSDREREKKKKEKEKKRKGWEKEANELYKEYKK